MTVLDLRKRAPKDSFGPARFVGRVFEYVPSKRHSAMPAADLSGDTDTPGVPGGVAQDYLHAPFNSTHHIGVANSGIVLPHNYIFGGWLRSDEDEPDSQIAIALWDANKAERQINITYDASTLIQNWSVVMSPDGTQGDQLNFPSTFPFAFGEWHLIIGAHDGISGKAIICVDEEYTDEANYQLGIYAGDDDPSRFVIGSNSRTSAGVLNTRKPLDGGASRIFTAKPAGRVTSLLQDLRSVLWNGGLGLTYDEFVAHTTAAERTAWGFDVGEGSWYDLDDTGTWSDAIGTHDLSATGTVPARAAPLGSSGDGKTIYQCDDTIGGVSLLQPTASKQPIQRIPGLMNGRPDHDFDGTDDLLVASGAGLLSSAAGGIMIAFRYDSALTGDHTLFGSADEASTNDYFRVYVDSANSKVFLQVRDSGVFNNSIRFDDMVTSVNTTHTLLITADGSTTYTGYFDGVLANTKSVTSGADDGKWLDLVPGRDNVTIGGLKTSTGEIEHFNGRIAYVCLVNDTNASQAARIAEWLHASFN